MTTLQDLKLTPGTYTGYEVFKHVHSIVDGDIRRLFMHDWITTCSTRRSLGISGYEKELIEQRTDRSLPDCNTIACLAGWFNIVTNQEKYFSDITGVWTLFGFELLGYDDILDDYPEEDREAVTEFNTLFYSCHISDQEAANRFNELIEKHKDWLISKKLEVVK